MICVFVIGIFLWINTKHDNGWIRNTLNHWQLHNREELTWIELKLVVNTNSSIEQLLHVRNRLIMRDETKMRGQDSDFSVERVRGKIFWILKVALLTVILGLSNALLCIKKNEVVTQVTTLDVVLSRRSSITSLSQFFQVFFPPDVSFVGYFPSTCISTNCTLVDTHRKNDWKRILNLCCSEIVYRYQTTCR